MSNPPPKSPEESAVPARQPEGAAGSAGAGAVSQSTSGQLLSVDAIADERAAVLASIAQAASREELEQVRIGLIGRRGRISQAIRSLGAMEPQRRRVISPLLNGLKVAVEDSIAAARNTLNERELAARVAAERVDITLPVRQGAETMGRIHPLTQTVREIYAIYADMGFQVAQGPDIESDFRNFTALNFGDDHPARHEQDTFYLPPDATSGELRVLRTHTSPSQIRTMMAQQPPIRIIAPGRTYRSDSDQTHTPMFHQVEGLVIDESADLGQLKWVLRTFCCRFFERDDIAIRFRPSHFPFTEPSMEVDINCRHDADSLVVGEGDDWLEVLGCGMTHPRVIQNCGLDAQRYQGFAWGIGIDRLAMLKYSLPDLRSFFAGDLRWLRRNGFGIASCSRI